MGHRGVHRDRGTGSSDICDRDTNLILGGCGVRKGPRKIEAECQDWNCQPGEVGQEEAQRTEVQRGEYAESWGRRQHCIHSNEAGHRWPRGRPEASVLDRKRRATLDWPWDNPEERGFPEGRGQWWKA